MFALPSPLTLNIDRQKADKALEKFNKLYAERATHFPDPDVRGCIENTISKLPSEWLVMTITGGLTCVEITPGHSLETALGILEGTVPVPKSR